MQCLFKYKWVKLMRAYLPEGKGILAAWARLASRAAFRRGIGYYCGFQNPVTPGMWTGGIVGLKSILGIRNRAKALEVMDRLQQLGYIRYELDAVTKKLTYQMLDWVMEYSGEGCNNGTVYTTDGFGFLCLPRSIPDRLAEQYYTFEEADAWLDLWCHTVYQDYRNAFSFLAPTAQYGRFGALLTLETLGQRWGWEKTKVWRFFRRHGDVFVLYRLPGSYGSLIFNKLYPVDTEVSLPTQEEVVHILEEIRTLAANVHRHGTDHAHMSRMVAWFSKQLLEHAEDSSTELSKSRVAHSLTIYRAYFSPCRSWKNCEYDCRSVSIRPLAEIETNKIRGPCLMYRLVDITEIGKELFCYG